MKLLRTLLPALALSASAVLAPIATDSAQASSVCGSDDIVNVYNASHGVGASGRIGWGTRYSGAYRIALSDYWRDGRYGVLYIQYFKHNVGWVDREAWSVGDGVQGGIASRTFVKNYQIDAIDIGVGRSGDPNYTVTWQRYNYC